mgnify:CR=1 FL=1
MKLQIKSLYLLCFATGAMLLSSCEDFLDRQEDEKLTFEKIWESRNTTKQYWLNFFLTTMEDSLEIMNPIWEHRTNVPLLMTVVTVL